MDYLPCRKCTFYVTAQDQWCPNCGIIHPLSPKAWVILAGGVSILLAPFLLMMSLFMTSVNTRVIVFLAYLLFSCLFWGSLIFYLNAKRDPQNSLDSTEVSIRNKIGEINLHKNRIKLVLQKLAALPSSNQIDRARQTSEVALQSLQRAESEFELLLWGCTLQRFYNQVLGFSSRRTQMDFNEIEIRIGKFNQLKGYGKSILKLWESRNPSQTKQGQELITLLNELLQKLETISQRLIVNQALIATRDVKPLNNSTYSGGTDFQFLFQDIGYIGERLSIETFLTTYHQLNNEYDRILAQEAAVRTVNHLN